MPITKNSLNFPSVLHFGSNVCTNFGQRRVVFSWNAPLGTKACTKKCDEINVSKKMVHFKLTFQWCTDKPVYKKCTTSHFFGTKACSIFFSVIARNVDISTFKRVFVNFGSGAFCVGASFFWDKPAIAKNFQLFLNPCGSKAEGVSKMHHFSL